MANPVNTGSDQADWGYLFADMDNCARRLTDAEGQLKTLGTSITQFGNAISGKADNSTVATLLQGKADNSTVTVLQGLVTALAQKIDRLMVPDCIRSSLKFDPAECPRIMKRECLLEKNATSLLAGWCGKQGFLIGGQ